MFLTLVKMMMPAKFCITHSNTITVNAQLQISAPLRISAPPIRLKICNKRYPLPPSPEKKGVSVLGTI